MNVKPVLSASDVKTILAAAESHAIAQHWAVTISVVDDGGHMLGLLRLDGAAPSSAFIAPGKARAAAVGRRETKGYEDMINQGRYSYLSVGMDSMLEGGVPIVVDNQVVGAVGVSGVKSDEDAAIARAGIAALNP